jgi:hypothetical protein
MRWYWRGLNRLPWAGAVVASFTLFSWLTNLWTPGPHWEIRGIGVDLLWFLG